MSYLAWFSDLSDEKLARSAGGKGASLCRMFRFGLPVPDGFIVCSELFTAFMQTGGLREKVLTRIASIDWDHHAGRVAGAKEIRDMIAAAPMTDELTDSIKSYYSELGNNVPVAIRSSSTAEDLSDASCAGQQDTYLYVIGEDDVIRHIKECWASLYNDNAIFYRKEKGFDEREVSIAVVVQCMVNSVKSGVMFTANPIDHRPDIAVIEAAWGLGEAIVGGVVTPDNYWINKHSCVVESEFISEKEVMVVRKSERGGTKEIPVPSDLAEIPVLNEAEQKSLVEIAVKVEDFYGKPQDIEWGIDENGKLKVLQSRPITTL
jgi:pyruvate,water dikinase